MKNSFFLAVALIALAVFPSAALATVTIGTPTFNKDQVSEGQEEVITVPVVSDNDVTSVVIEMKNTTLDLANSTYQNITTSLTGSPTNGHWIYFFHGYAGIYQIWKVFGTDNRSAIGTADYTNTFIGFRVTGSATTTTTITTATTATSSTNLTTTTTTSAQTATTSATSSSTAISSTTTSSTLFQGTPFEGIASFFQNNPLYLVIVALIVIIPVAILAIVFKRRPKDVLPEPSPNQESHEGQDDQEGSTYSQP